MNRRLTTLACCLVATALSAQTPPVKTDFNGDGKSDIVWQKTNTSAIVEQQMFNGGIIGQALVHTPANNNWVVVAAADANKDGKCDLFWQNRLTGEVFLMYMSGLDAVFTATATVPASKKIYTEANADWQIVLAADLDRDGYTDLLWHNKTDGRMFSMYLDATGSVKSTSAIIYTEKDKNWAPVAAANFSKVTNGSDVVWYNHSTGAVFLMPIGADGKPTAAGKVIYTEPNTAWKLVAAADFNNDGNVDLLWWNNTTGQVYLLLLDSSFAKISTDTGAGASGVIYTEPNTAGFVPVAVGDYNGDGFTDILWRNQVTGQVYMMFMDSSKPGKVNAADSQIVYTEADTTWRPVAGLTTVNITPPVTASTSTALTGETALPPYVPYVTVTKDAAITFTSNVRGPVSDTTLAWEVWNAAGTSKITDAAVATAAAGVFTGKVVGQDFLLKAISNADATKVANRLIRVVAAPTVTSFTVDNNSVKQGTAVNFSFAYTGTSATLTNDGDATSFDVTGKTSQQVTPLSSATWTLTAKNAANAKATQTAVVSVTTVNTALDCTITTNPAGVAGPTTYVTTGTVYTASVPTEAGVTYAWSLALGSAGSLSGPTNGNQVTYVPGASGTMTLVCTKTDSKGLSNSGSKVVTIVDAPTAPVAADFVSFTPGVVKTATTPDYVRAGVVTTIVVNGTPTKIPVLTYSSTTASTDPAILGGNVTYGGTFTPGATGAVIATLAYKNLAGTLSTATANVTKSFTITATPDATITSPAFATITTASANTATVPTVAGSTYSWTLTANAANAGATFTPTYLDALGADTSATSALTYTITPGTIVAGNKIDIAATVTNAAGLVVTTSPVKTVTLCANPVTPTGVTMTNSTVTVGYQSTATATVVHSTPGGNGYDDFSYVWTITNADLVGAPTVVTTGAGPYTSTITQAYKAKAAGSVTAKVKEVNAAGLSGTTTTVNAASTATAVVKPSIASFGVDKNLISFGDAATFSYSFDGGTGQIIDNSATILASATNVSGAGTATVGTKAVTTIAANKPDALHSITLRVTNAAGDFLEATPVAMDVAAIPVIASFTSSMVGTQNFGTTTTLQPNFTASVVPPYTLANPSSIYDGQIVNITPGPINAPVSGTNYVVQPAQGTTKYALNITNRAGKTVSQLANNNAVINAVVVSAITAPAHMTPAQGFTALTGGTVTGAVDSTQTWEITGDTTGGAQITGVAGAAQVKPGSSVTGGQFTIVSRSVADPSKVSAAYTVIVDSSAIAVTAPTLASATCGVGEAIGLSGSVVTHAANTTVTYVIDTDTTGGATIVGSTVKAGPNAGTITVKARANADGVTLSPASSTLTAAAIVVTAPTISAGPFSYAKPATISGGLVTGAFNNTFTYYISADTTGGGALATNAGVTTFTPGNTPGGSFTIGVKSVANTAKFTDAAALTTISVTNPNAIVNLGVGETMTVTGGVASGSGIGANTGVTYTKLINTDSIATLTGAGSFVGVAPGVTTVFAKAVADGATVSTGVPVTVAVITVNAPVYAVPGAGIQTSGVPTTPSVATNANNTAVTYSIVGAPTGTVTGAAVAANGTVTITGGTGTVTVKATSVANNAVTSGNTVITFS